MQRALYLWIVLAVVAVGCGQAVPPVVEPPVQTQPVAAVRPGGDWWRGPATSDPTAARVSAATPSWN